MALTNRKRFPNTVARRKIGAPGVEAQRPPQTPITITNTTPGDTSVFTFDQAVSLAGIPQWPNNAAHMPESAELTAPDELTLTYPMADTTTAITVPFQSEGVRNTAGGYVISGTFS